MHVLRIWRHVKEAAVKYSYYETIFTVPGPAGWSLGSVWNQLRVRQNFGRLHANLSCCVPALSHRVRGIYPILNQNL